MRAGKYCGGLRSAFVVLTLALMGAGPAPAHDDHDHDLARQALEAGEVLPLETILKRVQRDFPGEVMEVDLERKGERWIYEIKVLRTGGSLVKLKIDARDGQVLGSADRAAKERRGGSRNEGSER